MSSRSTIHPIVLSPARGDRQVGDPDSVLVAIGRFVRSLTEPAAMTGVPVPAPARRPLDPVTALTSYQREVLEWLAQGPSNKEIAGLLGVICQIQQMPVNKLSLAAAGGQPGILRQTFN